MKNDRKNTDKKFEDKKPGHFLSSMNLMVPFLTIISFILYKLSLKGCHGTESYCLVTLNPSFFYILGLFCMISDSDDTL